MKNVLKKTGERIGGENGRFDRVSSVRSSDGRMPERAQRLNRGVGRAVAVLVVGVLLLQHAPLGLLAHRATGGAEHGGCTERVCYCGEDCSCAHCAHHDGEGDTTGRGAPVEGPVLGSCSGPVQGPAGVFIVSKSLLAPDGSAAVGRPSPPAPVERCEAFAPQRVVDELFRPPRQRIG